MIESVQFKNFKALRDTTLPLGRFTLIVGPNGSGKSSALQALLAARSPGYGQFQAFATAGRLDQTVSVKLLWSEPKAGATTVSSWQPKKNTAPDVRPPKGEALSNDDVARMNRFMERIVVYTLDPSAIARAVRLEPHTTLAPNGAQLAGVLDRLRDQEPERFIAINDELGRWLPEFDQILFDTPDSGQRSVALRTREAGHKIPASELSQGTLLALAMLTVAYLPDPPPFVGFEEPDRGIHPRLLRDVRDALYRLAYPENFGESRDAVQVVATTHSPYFVDLFSDHPEEIVIAEKMGSEGRFVRLTDLPNYEEILRDAHLGEAWYTGILGGVPCDS